MTVRVLSLTSLLVSMTAGYAAAAVAGRAVSGAILSLVMASVFVVSYPPIDGIAYSSEHLLNVFAMLALLCATMATRPGRGPRASLWAFCAGASTMLAALSKQFGIVLAAPLGLWFAARAFEDRSGRDRSTLAFFGGLLVPFVALIARYAASHALGALYYYTITYNLDVYGAALQGAARTQAIRDAFLDRYDFLIFLAPLIGLAGAALLTPGSTFRDRLSRYGWHGFDHTVVLSLALVLAVSNTPLRNFRHYYVIIVPWAGLAGGVVVERAFLAQRDTSKWLSEVRRAIVLVPLLVLAHFGWRLRVEQYRKDPNIQGSFQTSSWEICNFLRKTTKPTDSIFIWGFDPAPYTACDRRSASRYVYTTVVAGFVPWVEASRAEEDARAAPGSRGILLEELRQNRPAVIFDSPGSMNGRSMLAYEGLKEFLTQNYCKSTVNLGPTTWIRKGRGGC
jgi:hypothetical protein